MIWFAALVLQVLTGRAWLVVIVHGQAGDLPDHRARAAAFRQRVLPVTDFLLYVALAVVIFAACCLLSD